MANSFRNVTRWSLLALLLLMAFIVVLLNLPLPALMADLGRSTGLRQILDHKKLIVLIVAVPALALAAWIVFKRNLRLMLVGAGALVLIICTYTVYKFQTKYPMADLFSAERYADNATLLLGKGVLLSRFDPKPTPVLQNKPVERTSYPVIDIHFHLESLPDTMSPELLIQAMDSTGIAQITNLGGIEGMFEHFARTFHDKYPDRIIMFVKPDPNALMKTNGIEKEMLWLRKAAAMGARGVKENKSFGLGQRDAAGKLVAVDDPRLDPYWNLAGKLGWPVLVHTGEPRSFWMPVDARNERYQELLENPDWSLYGKDDPAFDELMAQREHLLAKHPGTNFIGAHFGMNPDDLQYVGQLLDKYPNYYVDMSSVVSELGRHPYSTRRFFIKYQDRILFGSDGGYKLEPKSEWTAEHMFRSYIEFLETDNEYIEYPLQSITKQGAWRVHGIDLPADVLEKIYFKNAQRLLPSEADVKARLAALP